MSMNLPKLSGIIDLQQMQLAVLDKMPLYGADERIVKCMDEVIEAHDKIKPEMPK